MAEEKINKILDDLVVKYWDGNSMEIDNEAYDNVPTILEAEEE